MKNFFFIAMLGCVAAVSWASAQPTEQESLQIFSKADFCRQTGALNGNNFCEAWRTGYDEDPDVLIGYVLLKTLIYHNAELRVLVGIGLDGKISKVVVKGPEAIDQEFLAQFEGKNLKSSFEIAKGPEDLLFVPAKIRAISGKVGLSEEITNAVSALMKSALDSPKLTFAK